MKYKNAFIYKSKPKPLKIFPRPRPGHNPGKDISKTSLNLVKAGIALGFLGLTLGLVKNTFNNQSN